MVTPALPAALLGVACAVAARVQRASVLAAGCALALLAMLLRERRTWAAEVRRVAYLASHARGLWLDAAVDLAVAASLLALASALRRSPKGFATAAVLALAATAASLAAR